MLAYCVYEVTLKYYDTLFQGLCPAWLCIWHFNCNAGFRHQDFRHWHGLQATTAGAPSDANCLESFLAKLGLSEHLQALQSCGYDLDTLERGSKPQAAFVITPDRLREDSQQRIPIGQCAETILHAAELNE